MSKYILYITLECHDDCKTCIGNTTNDCSSCWDPNKVMYQLKCIYDCPIHYFPYNQICMSNFIIKIVCHNTCNNCFDSSISGCKDCLEGTFLIKGQCVDNCPLGSYLSDSKECLSCIKHCSKCASGTKCLECEEDAYWDDDVCVLTCPEGKYVDQISKTCKNCSNACYSCNGPTENDCIVCNFLKGYGKINEDSGTCTHIVCTNGYYLYKNTITNTSQCMKCDKSCLTCKAGGPLDCINCKPGYMSINLHETHTVQCVEYPEGYEVLPNGNYRGKIILSIEICGDGLNLGSLECDDGNLNDGDGCSSECMIEEGFECIRTSTRTPDICRSTIKPLASLSIIKGNQIVINFNKRVRSKVSSKF